MSKKRNLCKKCGVRHPPTSGKNCSAGAGEQVDKQLKGSMVGEMLQREQAIKPYDEDVHGGLQSPLKVPFDANRLAHDDMVDMRVNRIEKDVRTLDVKLDLNKQKRLLCHMGFEP